MLSVNDEFLADGDFDPGFIVGRWFVVFVFVILGIKSESLNTMHRRDVDKELITNIICRGHCLCPFLMCVFSQTSLTGPLGNALQSTDRPVSILGHVPGCKARFCGQPY